MSSTRAVVVAVAVLLTISGCTPDDAQTRPSTDRTTTGTNQTAGPDATPAVSLDLGVADDAVTWTPGDGDGAYRVVVDDVEVTTIGRDAVCTNDTCSLGFGPDPDERLVRIIATTSARDGTATVPPIAPPEVRAPRNEVQVVRIGDDDIPTVEVIATDSRREAVDLAREVAERPNVVTALPDVPLVPLGPGSGQPLSLVQPGHDEAEYVRALRLSAVHDVTRGAGRTIAVVDLGVALLPIFEDRLRPGANVMDGDFDGTVPLGDHGTQVAGLVAGADQARPGAAPAATIVPMALVDPELDVVPSAAYLVAALLHPAVRDSDVVTMSLGLALTAVNVGALDEVQAALGQLARSGTVLVAATGNHATEACWPESPFDVDVAPLPAASPDVVAVTGVDYDCGVSLPPDGPGLHAPATSVPVTGSDGFVRIVSGTSFAAPLVAGLVADLQACGWNPSVSPVDVLARHDVGGVDPVAALEDPDARCWFHLADTTVGVEGDVQVALVGDLVHRGEGRLDGTGGLRLPDGLDCGPAFPDGVADVGLVAEIDTSRSTVAVDVTGIDVSTIPDEGSCATVATWVRDWPGENPIVGNEPDGGAFSAFFPVVEDATLELRSGRCPDDSGWCGSAPATPPPPSAPPADRALLREDGLGPVDFGTASAEALDVLGDLFGDPIEEEASDPICQATGRWLRWDDDLEVTLLERAYDPETSEQLDEPVEVFAGWDVTGDSPLTTVEGVGTGTTVRELRGAVPGVEVRPARREDIFDNGFPVDLPPDFEFPPEEEFSIPMDGVLTDATPTGRIRSISSGQGDFCFE